MKDGNTKSSLPRRELFVLLEIIVLLRIGCL